jgi:hypothetical protein
MRNQNVMLETPVPQPHLTRYNLMRRAQPSPKNGYGFPGCAKVYLGTTVCAIMKFIS